MNKLRPIHLVLPCPLPKAGQAWGDYYFGQSLANALRSLGHSVIITCNGEKRTLLGKLKRSFGATDDTIPREAIDLVLRGKRTPVDQFRRPRLNWLISQSDQFSLQDANEAAYTFVASQKFADELLRQGVKCEVLLQCTDPSVFSPDRKSKDQTTGVLFVGNRKRTEPRPIVEAARDAGFEVSVWGANWKNVTGLDFRGRHIPNADLGNLYASAGTVLNDHRFGMLRDDFMSNRVFDVLASGRPVVTEEMFGIPEKLRPAIFTYRSLTEIYQVIKSSQQAETEALSTISRIVRANHSFAQRAQVISERISVLTH